MADSRDGEREPRLPIKVILPNQGKERPVPGEDRRQAIFAGDARNAREPRSVIG
jgi:hypothetical protein